MKWIIAAILVFIAGYTYLTLHYRKPGKPYQPYDDMRTRANTGKLLAAGYQRVELTAVTPSEGAAPANNTLPAPGGLPEALRAPLVIVPLLPTDIAEAQAAKATAAQSPYLIRFRCLTADDKHQFAGAELYVHGDEITVTPRFDRLTGGLQSRSRDHRVVLTVPPGTLKPGTYHVTLVGEQSSRAWMLEVR